ncbi:MAG: Seryl-tRNA synthetase N-terminal domain, partial [Patescibacteria group bacterium]|nr:Seryl-tRNA synthetase N-terminal domain [Patescibacteria group bacterium]
MIDIKILRENPDRVRAAISKKHGDLSLVDRLITIDADRR